MPGCSLKEWTEKQFQHPYVMHLADVGFWRGLKLLRRPLRSNESGYLSCRFKANDRPDVFYAASQPLESVVKASLCVSLK